MSTPSGDEESGRRVERGGAGEAAGAPLTSAEEEASARPGGATPGPDEEITDAEWKRLKELNPDDFE
ncbi:hypothetical protein [Sphaerisporangium perillae]|uniref:hypothetical protein n=1 Tax=Sphaerisporangium perillae TaxID=2935860 RepID=UPI00200C6FA4|nr:hypothetical protein [Sphaerisporangium perillae]